MTVIVDTNVLVRASALDDPTQGRVAASLLRGPDGVCVPTTALCEYVWVLRRAYNKRPADIAASLRALIASPSVRVDQTLVDKGMEMLDAGGDFTDGVIAAEGQWLGGDEFVTFDRQAAKLLPQLGVRARDLTV